ncbi:MAG: hypothetical protein R3D51_17115 [Hyphomicrobiaceae bacterium]
MVFLIKHLVTDVRSGVSYAYTYNNANRLKTVSQSGNLIGTYTYSLVCAPARAAAASSSPPG